VIKKLFRDSNSHILRRFNKEFKKDSTGKNRDFRAMEEGAIKDLFDTCKDAINSVIEEFKYI